MDAGLPNGLPDNLLADGLVCTPAVYRTRKQVSLGLHPAVVLTERWQQGLAQRDFPVDAAFALDDAKYHALAVYVADLQPAQLGPAQARRVESHQQRAVVQIARSCNQLRHFSGAENNRQGLSFFRIR